MEIEINSLQVKLNQVITFLDPLLPLANCHMVEFITNNLWESLTPSAIREEVKSSHECNINNVFNQIFSSIDNQQSYDISIDTDKTIPNQSPSSLLADRLRSMDHFPNVCNFLSIAREVSLFSLSDMMSLPELQEKLMSLGSGTHKSLYVDQFMTCKKAHEVEVMSQVVASLANACQATHVVDVGSGKGYLSSMLALHHGLSVLGIDSSQSTSHGAAKRTKKLVRVWNGISKKGMSASGSSSDKQKICQEAAVHYSVEDVNKPSPSRSKFNAEEKCLYKQATLFVTPHMNLLNLVEDYFPGSQDQDNQLALVGLHTCGDLAPTSLRIFASNEHVKGLCIVGCCHHLLNEEFVLGGEEPPNQPTAEYGFPMSDYLRSKQFVLGRNARMLAAQSLERIVNTEPSLDSLFYRALLQVLLKDKLGSNMPQGNVGRLAAKCSNFTQYALKALNKLGLDIKVSEEEIEALYAKHTKDLEHLQAFFLLRLVLAPVVEVIILLDRLLFLLEQDIQEAYVVQMFDPLVSPRCYGIIALKKSTKLIPHSYIHNSKHTEPIAL